MNLIVSNVGLRLLQQLRDHPDERPVPVPVLGALLDLRIAALVPFDDTPDQRDLVARGLAQLDDRLDLAATELRYQRNPLQHVERVVFEYTTVCNLDCGHCRNGHVPPVTEAHPERLAEVVDQLVPLGIRRFDFVGGEVSLYGARWLQVVERIRQHPGATAAVVTNGWFLEERDFKAAGVAHADDASFLRSLAEAGLTHVIFSLDGPAELHDANRASPGLYDRILRGFERVRAAGLLPRVSLLVHPSLDEAARDRWMAEVAEAVYQLSPSLPVEQKVARLYHDDPNYLSSLVDTGNPVRLRRSRDDLFEVPTPALRCKNFFRPYPSLRIQASGQLALCPLVDAGEGLGDLHERGIVALLNGMQDTFIYQLHADDRIGDYRRFVDPALFGARFAHVCGLRTVIAMIARRMHERGVDESDVAALHAINEEVARKAGFLPALGKTANGTRRPY